MTDDTRYAEGLAVRRAVLGEAHVARASANVTAFDADFQRFITEGAWGSVWSRPHFSRRERSVVTLALLAALGHHEEVALHVRATANTGATPEDVAEAMLHVAVYAGVPAANSAIRIVKQTYAAMAAEAAESAMAAEAAESAMAAEAAESTMAAEAAKDAVAAEAAKDAVAAEAAKDAVAAEGGKAAEGEG